MGEIVTLSEPGGPRNILIEPPDPTEPILRNYVLDLDNQTIALENARVLSRVESVSVFQSCPRPHSRCGSRNRQSDSDRLPLCRSIHQKTLGVIF